jgi:hypothetical protein
MHKPSPRQPTLVPHGLGPLFGQRPVRNASRNTKQQFLQLLLLLTCFTPENDPETVQLDDKAASMAIIPGVKFELEHVPLPNICVEPELRNPLK